MTTNTVENATATKASRDFSRVLNPGKTFEYRPQGNNVYVKVEYKGGRLSLSGVEGPKSDGDAVGSCGQIDPIKIGEYAEGWTAELVNKLNDVWSRWHLNDMRAGCEHQRAENWNKRPIDPAQSTDRYITLTREGEHYPYYQGWNMLTWITRKEHPQGLLSEPCPTCGYKYGSAWLREDVPADVLDFLRGLPETKITPAWV